MKLNTGILLVFVFVGVACAAANDLIEDDPVTGGKDIFRNLVRPFRMEKLNLIWVKAQQVNIILMCVCVCMCVNCISIYKMQQTTSFFCDFKTINSVSPSQSYNHYIRK